ncbi:J domain-containing protein [Oscillatoria salina]|uniref:J domain-containing protein n=1 Tax=Oscillatoria salina TaxID=331517 RepID=UPI0013B60C8A|nr:DnaJ domain-containing protein [Oscillatoria salina]MBZ8180685.1 DnaJ domain-containing protein [Oscillatoria salina IIICB1]NET87375.1 DnaJ domain-containing protein [Kamptonema sp. SIO1D9]
MSFNIERGLFKFEIADYHAVLGIPLNADPKVVRKQYLKIARSLHPDSFKGEDRGHKRQASEMLSKLVNPAYEQLSKDKSRAEYQLVLAQMGQRLAREGGKPSVIGKSAQELLQAGANVDLAYSKLLQKLATEQYKYIDQVLDTVAEISELNLVYLMRKQGQGIKQPVKVQANEDRDSKKVVEKEEKPLKPKSQAEPYLNRAQEYMGKNNYSQAILELRDALKLEPNNAIGHALLGTAYLKQKQGTMAKVHINKAYQLSPQEPIVIQAKQALDKVSKGTNGTKSDRSKASAKSNNSGMFGGLFGKK